MKNKSDDMICCGFDVISVCSLIDYGQQTMKMLTEQMPRCCININITRGRSLTITKYNKKMILHCGSCYLN